MALFGRVVLLQVGMPGTTGKSFRDLRIVFDCKLSASSTPNSAVIEVFNLNPNSIALLQDPAVVVRVLAGYGDQVAMIFQGNPTKNGVRLDRRGPDRVLHIEAEDGGRAYQDARVNVSFATSTTLAQVWAELVTQMGLPTGTVRLDEAFVFPQGVTLVGPAREVLDRLAASTGSTWLLRDGALSFIGVGENTGEEAVVFSPATGLIGSPSPADDGGVEVTALIAPTLRPGKLFKLESESYSGLYLAGDVGFKGDSGWGSEFFVTAKGTPSTRTEAT